MKKLLSFCCAVLLISGAAAAPLFENGKTGWQIVLPANSGNEMSYAATELTAALKKCCKVLLKNALNFLSL